MSSQPLRRAVFPGSFNPLTVAHLAVAKQARDQHNLDIVELVLSTVALDKPAPPGPPLAERIDLIGRDLADLDWCSVRTTEEQLIADIAEGYDAVIMGADKWAQVNDVKYYESETARDQAVGRLPKVIVADRAGMVGPTAFRLETDPSILDVSSTAARQGDRSIMAPEAAKAWSDDGD